jgi:signal transduction histidine kinase
VVDRGGQRAAFRVAITLYAAGLLVWLLLGLLPFVAMHVGFVHDAIASAATHDSILGRTASRVLHPDTMADTTTMSQTVVQYLFSALNVALGLLLVVRRPDDPVPRLLGFALLGTAATFNLPSHRAFHIIGNPWPVAAVHFTFHIVSGVTYMWAVILFPDGRLPPQIRIGRRTQAAGAAGFTALVAILCWRSSFLAHPQFFVIFFGIAVPVVGIAAQVMRLRDPHTTTSQRRVARMLCGALLPAFATALLWLACRLVAAASSGTRHADAALWTDRISTWFPVVFAVVPVVLFAAVLRYRLWDVDRWLTRVLVYGVLTLAIAIGYVVGVLVAASLFGPNALWTMVLTLAVVAALVEPARVWLRRWANRVVFGVSLDPQEALRTLSEGLDRLTPAEELDRLTSVALHATRANAVRLWLIDGDEVLCSAAAPSAAGRDPVAIADLRLREGASFDAVAHALGETVCCPVRHQGELLGLLAASTTDGTAMPGKDRTLLADIADHAGLLVHNAALTVGLARHAARLAATSRRLRRVRRRLVAAQDAERRRLERNLHDGAQQALVAALIDIGRVDAPFALPVARRTVAMAADSLTELLIADRPAVLDEVGLVEAITRAAAPLERLGIAVTVRRSGDISESEVTTAVYFCCVEALQNIAKYAAARTVDLEFDVVDDDLVFAVTDDGVGFDIARADAAGGLRHLDERLAVVGGTLTVDTRMGAGTRIAGQVPARSNAAAAP